MFSADKNGRACFGQPFHSQINMRILILHMRFHPDLTGTGPLVTDLASYLAASGDQVTVVTSMPHYGRREVPSKYKGHLVVREEFQGAKVWRTCVYVPPSAHGFHRSLNYLSYTFMSVLSGMVSDRPDVILCVNPPITVGFSGWLVSLVRRVPMIFNVQDIWPDCIVIMGQLRNRMLIRFFKCLEKFIYHASARVAVLSDGMKKNLAGKGVKEEKIVVIPNWADVEYIRPLPKENRFCTAHHLNGRFAVMFAGNLGFNAVLENVLDAAYLLKDDTRIVFLIVGEGNAKPGLVERSKSLGLTNVIFLPTQPKAMLPEMLASADISIVTLNRELGQLNVPSKTYSIMASARPVLAAVPEDSEIKRVIDEAGCGRWVPPEDPKSMAHAIEKLKKEPELLESYGNNGRRYVVLHHDKPALMARYRQLLGQVSGARA